MGKIIAIIPAPGWWAIYESDQHVWSVPLVCWALHDDGEVEGRVVEGDHTVRAWSHDFNKYNYAPEEKD